MSPRSCFHLQKFWHTLIPQGKSSWHVMPHHMASMRFCLIRCPMALSNPTIIVGFSSYTLSKAERSIQGTASYTTSGISPNPPLGSNIGFTRVLVAIQETNTAHSNACRCTKSSSTGCNTEQVNTVSDPPEEVLLMEHLDPSPVCATEETSHDPILSHVLQFVLNGWPASYNSTNLKPFWSRQLEPAVSATRLSVVGSRVVVPPSISQTMLQQLHDSHLGKSRMKSLGRMFV